ncbi:lytic transglycosylase domain-containing protein [Novosphingobium sp. BW1]|nr:lytic transglycosylase domain-containing protein [Novosphingobium sp. BW1]
MLQAAIVLATGWPGSGFAASAPPPDAGADVAAVPADRTSARLYASYVAEAAQRFAIPENWIWAVMRIESRGDRRAVSAAGAMGLMQIMPATWTDLSARYGLGSDPFDARANIHAGAAYLRAMWNRYGDLGATLAAYNAGPGRTDASLARRRALPAETTSYVARFMRISGANSGTAGAPWSAADPLAWRRGALFTAPSRAAQDSAVPAAGRALVRAASSESDAQISPSMPASNPLFVALSGETRP